MSKSLPRLIILSDLWGNTNLSWSKNFESHFNIQHYNSSVLACVPKNLNSEKEIHQYFIRYGITQAIQNICTLEKGSVNLIGFSIGGVIAWKATLLGLNTLNLFCISSTRLRYENSKPHIPIFLFFGARDNHIPTINWFNDFEIKPEIIPNENHQVYLNQGFLTVLQLQIINSISLAD
jgi:pimeloyl-ACP methyl ester carboxylesterase